VSSVAKAVIIMSRFSIFGVIGLAQLAFAQAPCGPWGIVPTADRGTVSNLLHDVEFISPQSGLAVGNWNSGVGVSPLVQQWDGDAWSELTLPPTGMLGTLPKVEGVGQAGSGYWVVGSVYSGYPTENLPLIMRRQGSEWTLAETPVLRPQNTYPFGPRGGLAADVVGVSEDDVWIVGSAAGYGDASSTSVPMALHFDGSNWADIDVPLAGNRSHRLEKVAASDTDNVWAVGYWRSIAQNYQALVVRWDGTSWAHVANPGEGPAGGDATCVAVLAPDDVWVSGSFNGGADHLIHWTGSSWEVVNAGLPGPFAAMVAIGPDDIWGSCAINATYYHYDGQVWSPVPGTPIPGSSYVLRGWGLAAVGACDVWSVGGWSDGAVQRTFSEHLGEGDCAADLNADGVLDLGDIMTFVDAFTQHLEQADMNRDGVFDLADVGAFLAAFNAGCQTPR